MPTITGPISDGMHNGGKTFPKVGVPQGAMKPLKNTSDGVRSTIMGMRFHASDTRGNPAQVLRKSPK